jgi:hypothetical protein
MGTVRLKLLIGIGLWGWAAVAAAQTERFLARVQPVDPTNRNQSRESTRVTIEAFCICITHRQVEPCTKDVRMVEEAALKPDPCPEGQAPGPNVQCGHTLALHNPTNPYQAPSAFDVVGYLQDARQPTRRTFILPTVPRWHFPYGVGKYLFTYQAGQVTGDILLEGRASEPEPFHFFLSRAEHPGGCDVVSDDRQICWSRARISIEYTHLQEVPPPSEEMRDPATGRFPYVRCGYSRECSLNKDSAYHPNPFDPDDPRRVHHTVHWADPTFRETLIGCLVPAWLARCSDPAGPVGLALLDISLPRGGLLDIGRNWSSSPGHFRHRRGTDADLDDASLAGRCAGQGWYQVLWRRPSPNELSMGEQCGLTYPFKRTGPDYNHVCPGRNNRCF